MLEDMLAEDQDGVTQLTHAHNLQSCSGSALHYAGGSGPALLLVLTMANCIGC